MNHPYKLARLRAYLAHRQPGQSFQSFWDWPVAEKEKQMTKIETRTTSYTLTSGIELHVRNNGQQIALQLRQPPIADTDESPLSAAGIQLGTPLTLPECVELTQTLLSFIALRIGESRESHI